MKYLSTKNSKLSYNLSEALESGLASDGGLFVPETLPLFDLDSFEDYDFHSIAKKVLTPFFEDDNLFDSLDQIVHKAFNFPVKLEEFDENTSVLELFHGPTAAFKDFGARFLAQCFSHLKTKRTILVATSGDTGGAVASAFYNDPNINVAILFPKGKVSALQEKQLTCWGNNVKSFRVEGDFDDCQRMVKEAFNCSETKKKYSLTSANSINIGRLLPQTIYYASSSLWHKKEKGTLATYIIPTGNMGNVMGAIWAKLMGFPIKNIVMSTNANKVIADYFLNGVYKVNPSKKTIANAMDVSNPSNFERFRKLYPSFDDLPSWCKAFAVTDSEIKETIVKLAKKGKVYCPHTATVFHLRFLKEEFRDESCVVVATAHPAKFKDIISPIIKNDISSPSSLNEIQNKESNCFDIGPSVSELVEKL